jgi:hypothetical protein
MRRLRALDVIVALLLVAWAVAWTCGIRHRYFDYDELEHLYAVWRIRSGGRPFYDFFEGHPPFMWYALSVGLPVFDLFTFPLFSLRFLSAAGNIVLLWALGKNVALSFSRLPAPAAFSWRAFAVAAAVIGGHLSVIWYLVEFRIDAWPNALMLLAIYRYRKSAGRPFRSAFVLAFVSSLTLLCTPKLAAFFALFALCSLVAEDARLARLAGLGAGALAAVLAGCLCLRVAGLSPRLAYQLCITYHVALGAKGGFGHGLAQAIVAQPQLVAVLFSALAAWLLVAERRLRRFPFEVSVVAFLIFQAAFVAFGFPQYYAPWFLLGLVFVPYVELVARRRPALHRFVIAAGLVFAGANLVRDLGVFPANNQTAPVVAFNDWARRNVPPDATVAGDLLSMPIYRRSPFYHLADSKQPNGYTTEAAMTDIGLPWIAERMTPAAYDRQLEAARPALFVPSRLLSEPQSEAIARYRARHAAELHAVPSPAGTVELTAYNDSGR